MSRARMCAAFIAAAALAGCGGLSGGAVPSTGGNDRAPQTLRAVPISSPTPAPKAPLVLRAVPIQSPTPTPDR